MVPIGRCIDSLLFSEPHSLTNHVLQITVKIREYRRADFEQLYQIDHAAFSEDIAYSRLELQYYLRSCKCRTLVFEEASEIVGFVVGCSEPRKLGTLSR